MVGDAMGSRRVGVEEIGSQQSESGGGPNWRSRVPYRLGSCYCLVLRARPPVPTRHVALAAVASWLARMGAHHYRYFSSYGYVHPTLRAEPHQVAVIRELPA